MNEEFRKTRRHGEISNGEVGGRRERAGEEKKEEDRMRESRFAYPRVSKLGRILTLAPEKLGSSLLRHRNTSRDSQFDVERLGAIIIRFWDAAFPRSECD